MILRYQPSLNEVSSNHIGNDDSFYQRIRVQEKGKLSLGLTMEKDAGEALWNDSIKGFDFYSYHFQLESKTIFQKTIFGDYQIQSGQGLVFGAGFSPGKGASHLSARKSNIGILPYTSIRESGFFRGAATTIEYRDFNLTALASITSLDGRVHMDSSLNRNNQTVNSIYTSGYHRTSNELASKGEIDQKNIGYILTLNPTKKLEVGSTFLYSVFDRNIQPPQRKYNQYSFRGRSNSVLSAFLNYQLPNGVFFSEWAHNINGGNALVTGASITLSRSIETTLLYRNYDKDFNSFYSSGFSEASNTQNENGLYWAFHYRLNSIHSINAYMDHFRFPWLRYRVDQPSSGNDYMVRYDHQPSKRLNSFALFRFKNKQLNNESNTGILNTKKVIAGLGVIFDATEWLRFKTRVQYTHFHGSQLSEGMALAQDIKIHVGKFKIYHRTAFYQTDSYETRQYMYENDLLYRFSVPAYHGVGIRQYFMLNYKPTRRVNLWIKYGRYHEWDDDKSRPGNISFQLMVKK